MSPKQTQPQMAQQARAWAVALDMVYYMLGGGVMGFGIDYYAGTSPMWMLIIGGVGLVVGIYRFITESLKLVQEGSKRPPRGSAGSDEERPG